MSAHRLTLTTAALRELLRGGRPAASGPAAYPVGFSHRADEVEWLIHSVRWLPDRAGHRPLLRATVAASGPLLHERLHSLVLESDTAGVLVIGAEEAAGRLVALRNSPAG